VSFSQFLKTFLFPAELQNWNWTELCNALSVDCRCRQCTRNTACIVLYCIIQSGYGMVY